MSLIQVDPIKRYSASEATLHPWITQKNIPDLTERVLNEAQQVIRQRLEARERRQKKSSN